MTAPIEYVSICNGTVVRTRLRWDRQPTPMPAHYAVYTGYCTAILTERLEERVTKLQAWLLERPAFGGAIFDILEPGASAVRFKVYTFAGATSAEIESQLTELLELDV